MTAKHTFAVNKPRTEDPTANAAESPEATTAKLTREIGGRKTGLEPTRYGDWEKNGRCIDF